MYLGAKRLLCTQHVHKKTYILDTSIKQRREKIATITREKTRGRHVSKENYDVYIFLTSPHLRQEYPFSFHTKEYTLILNTFFFYDDLALIPLLFYTEDDSILFPPYSTCKRGCMMRVTQNGIQIDTPRQKKAILGWLLYDAGNSAYATTVAVGVLPAFFAGVIVGPAGIDLFGLTLSATTLWGCAVGIAAFLLFCLAPVLGALADRIHAKNDFLSLFVCWGFSPHWASPCAVQETSLRQ